MFKIQYHKRIIRRIGRFGIWANRNVSEDGTTIRFGVWKHQWTAVWKR